MKISFPLLVGLLFLVSCSPAERTSEIEPSDDYVLIEFASKLEEDYHRLHKIPYDTSTRAQQAKEPDNSVPNLDYDHGTVDDQHP